MRKILFSITLLTYASVIQAQDSLKILNEIVITATRSEQEIIDVSRTIEVVDQEEIKRSTANTVGELLSTKTGIYVVGANQTPGTNQDLFLRGANSNHVAILIDGVRVTDPSSPNNAFNLAELSLANVERIEIVHGSHSTMYGSAAIGGVINIITKKGTVGLNGNASLRGGMFSGGGLYEGIGYLNYGFENGFYLSGSAFLQQVDGLDASIDTISTSGFKTADKDDFNKKDISVKAGFKNEKWDNFIEFKRANQKAEIDDGAFNDDDNYYLDLERDYLNYSLSYKLNDIGIKFNGGLSSSERIAVNDSSVIDQLGNFDHTYYSSSYSGNVFSNELTFSYKSKNFTFITGFGDYSERMNFNNYYYSNSMWGVYESEVNYDSLDLKANIKHAFISTNISPGKNNKFNTRLGLRYDHHNRSGSHITYELSPSYKLSPNTMLYFSYSRGFNAPSLYQLYDPTPGFVTVRGNSNLQPEISGSIELGWKQYFNSGLTFTASIFNNRVNQAIEYVYLWNGETAVEDLSWGDFRGDTYINVKEQEVNGLELSVSGYAVKNVHFNLNLTALSADIQINDADLDRSVINDHHVQIYSNGAFVSSQGSEKSKLVRRPSLLINTGIGYDLTSKSRFILQYQHIGSRNDAIYDPNLGPFGALGVMELGSYNLINLSSTYSFNEKLSAIASLNNLLNEQYNEINGFNSIGRSLYLKVIYEF